jgi:hypothetical protein
MRGAKVELYMRSELLSKLLDCRTVGHSETTRRMLRKLLDCGTVGHSETTIVMLSQLLDAG